MLAHQLAGMIDLPEGARHLMVKRPAGIGQHHPAIETMKQHHAEMLLQQPNLVRNG